MKFLDWLFGYKEPNKMYKRLDRLWNYCCQYDLNKLPDITYETCKNGHLIEFKSAQGTVRTELTWSEKYMNAYELTYSDYAGAKVFFIAAWYSDLTVKPYIGEDLMAEDIDLALFELETYVEQLGDVEQKMEQDRIEEQRKQEIHNAEIKKLC